MEALWAQLLRKDTVNVPNAPPGPVDRNATSARILLYDTQARLEQFSSRADTMLKEMSDANHQLKTVGMLFEKDRESQTSDMIDLGLAFEGLCQTEILKTIGKPAQQPEFLAFQEKLELRVEGLNQRLDALQMFNQTHSQALETHSQTLKSIQDQQNALLTAILPLLTLVQSIFPQIEKMKEQIQEVKTESTSAWAAFRQDFAKFLAIQQQQSHTQATHKRQLSIQSAASSPIVRKKIRTESLVSRSSTTHESKGTPAVLTHLVIPGKSDAQNIDHALDLTYRPPSTTPQSDAVQSTHNTPMHPIRSDSIKRSSRLQVPSSRTLVAQTSIPSFVNTRSGSRRISTNSWHDSKTPLSNKHSPQCPTSMPPPRSATKVQGPTTSYSTVGSAPPPNSWRLMTSNQAPFRAATILSKYNDRNPPSVSYHLIRYRRIY
ncbi:hypothetical protein AGABI1DRAFT_126286 [Agaricus bisporus var. burnettii JB137-S8]|uniref:Uncharacterized protein n=1 Tax=Agaricus bisporus var. burnettii (strain JB137-S8 / ATCC MYA-4627 / FGSC 10392) TaxID=597362 RepID=K5XEW0_AGABU|nr:uncharacterized protein AGABI1DRAFT_126286 [Agaricus bisporus var. burnettii JB137-S8]EKM81928.1 hypothetical protein AGABI1DRAFT_126286 [Agaricus bisporus var. burnettii JB137-S8]